MPAVEIPPELGGSHYSLDAIHPALHRFLTDSTNAQKRSEYAVSIRGKDLPLLNCILIQFEQELSEEAELKNLYKELAKTNEQLDIIEEMEEELQTNQEHSQKPNLEGLEGSKKKKFLEEQINEYRARQFTLFKESLQEQAIKSGQDKELYSLSENIAKLPGIGAINDSKKPMSIHQKSCQHPAVLGRITSIPDLTRGGVVDLTDKTYGDFPNDGTILEDGTILNGNNLEKFKESILTYTINNNADAKGMNKGPQVIEMCRDKNGRLYYKTQQKHYKKSKQGEEGAIEYGGGYFQPTEDTTVKTFVQQEISIDLLKAHIELGLAEIVQVKSKDGNPIENRFEIKYKDEMSQGAPQFVGSSFVIDLSGDTYPGNTEDSHNHISALKQFTSATSEHTEPTQDFKKFLNIINDMIEKDKIKSSNCIPLYIKNDQSKNPNSKIPGQIAGFQCGPDGKVVTGDCDSMHKTLPMNIDRSLLESFNTFNNRTFESKNAFREKLNQIFDREIKALINSEDNSFFAQVGLQHGDGAKLKTFFDHHQANFRVFGAGNYADLLSNIALNYRAAVSLCDKDKNILDIPFEQFAFQHGIEARNPGKPEDFGPCSVYFTDPETNEAKCYHTDNLNEYLQLYIDKKLTNIRISPSHLGFEKTENGYEPVFENDKRKVPIEYAASWGCITLMKINKALSSGEDLENFIDPEEFDAIKKLIVEIKAKAKEEICPLEEVFLEGVNRTFAHINALEKKPKTENNTEFSESDKFEKICNFKFTDSQKNQCTKSSVNDFVEEEGLSSKEINHRITGTMQFLSSQCMHELKKVDYDSNNKTLDDKKENNENPSRKKQINQSMLFKKAILGYRLNKGPLGKKHSIKATERHVPKPPTPKA